MIFRAKLIKIFKNLKINIYIKLSIIYRFIIDNYEFNHKSKISLYYYASYYLLFTLLNKYDKNYCYLYLTGVNTMNEKSV